MRLTLRNMLAYMDEILEPAQHQEIGQKIDDSEFATGIMHRIRDVTRRLRLGAPKPMGKGMGLDPNTVAMYLDNTMPAERVPDFEKVCLESDVHLAEVAACHQVLSLVLGEPAHVDPDLRRKMYNIVGAAQEGAATVADPSKIPPPLPKESRPSPAVRERPRVPEYLRQGRRSPWWTVAATLLLAVVLVAAVVRALGPYDATNPVAKLIGLGEPAEEVAANGNGQLTSPDATNGEAPTEPAAATPDAQNAAPEKGADERAATTEKVADRNANTAAPAAVEPAKAATPDPLPPVDETAAVAAKNDVPAVDSAAPAQADQAAAKLADADTTQTPAEPVAKTEPRGEARDVAGRLLADMNVLLRLNSDGQWDRLPPGAPVNIGDRLLVLPTFRPTVTLTSGLTAQLLGETMVDILPPDAKGVPGIRVPFGRLVLMNTANRDVPLRLDLGGQEGTATFADLESTLALEVRRFLPPGADPEKQPAQVAVDLYASSGEVTWTSDAVPRGQQLTAPARFTVAAHPLDPADPNKELPNWITEDKLSHWDQMANVDLRKALRSESDRSLSLVLSELIDPSRRQERSNLAARALALVGEFASVVPMLSDETYKAVWPQQIETLQAAMARSPDEATRVRQTLEEQRGQDGSIIYRMLRGYSEEDLLKGAGLELVEHVDAQHLDVRAVAFLTLRSLPGVPPGASFGYRPEGTRANRAQAIRIWQQWIERRMQSPRGDRPAPPAETEKRGAPAAPPEPTDADSQPPASQPGVDPENPSAANP